MYFGVCLNEGTNVIPNEIDYFGKKFKINIKDYYDNKDLASKNISIINSAIKAFCSNSLYSYLYKFQKAFIDDINSDPYFDNKKINGPKDLIDAIKNDKTNISKGFFVFIRKKNDKIVVYICGEYWLDDEHGFGISFPQGKIIKGDPDKKITSEDYDNITILSSYDMAL